MKTLTLCHCVLTSILVAVLAATTVEGQSPTLAVETRDGTLAVVARTEGGETILRRSFHAITEPVLRHLPGCPAMAATWTEHPPGADSVSWSAVSLDGRSFAEARETDYHLLLRYARFDPVSGPPEVPALLDGVMAGTRLFIVQYWAQGLEPWRDVIRAQGGAVHLFLANHADVVEMDPSAAAIVPALPFVRSVGRFHAAYKLEEELVHEVKAGAADPGLRALNVLTLRRGVAGKASVAERVQALGGVVHGALDDSYLLTVTLPALLIPELARLDDVQWIDRWSPPGDDMDVARSFHGANYVQSAGGYTGSGVRVEVLDGGCDTTHPDIQNFAVHTTTVAGAHGTCTSGIVVGSGAGNAAAKGVMPNAFLVIGYYNNFAGGSRYNHTAQLQNDSLSYKTVLQSNSWGSAQTTAYTSVSQNMDLILFDLQRISILNSQSNLGTQSSRPEAWAKNIISVGGIYHSNTESKSDDSWSGGASIGPAADGRLKPDIASFYDATLCTDVVGSGGYASGNYYSSFGGTSGATPISAGHLGLLYQMWADGVFGNSAPGATVYDDRPNNTTMKALLINTATQWTFSGTSHDLTRTHQGWGHPDLRTAWDLRGSMFIVDETDVLPNLASTTHSVTVAAGAPALKATMVYRDPPGTTSSTQHRINDLDLKVTSPGGTIYYGNNGLSAAMWSTSGGSPNTRDTVENVFVQNPESGTWQVQIIASQLNQDSHVETGGVDADYALVVSGVTTTPPTPPAAPTGLSATAISSSRIDLVWTDQSANESGFRIERSVSGGPFAPLATTGANVTTWPDTGLTPNTTYSYRVLAFNAGGDSAWSDPATATTPAGSTPVDDRANADLPVDGTVTNNYTSTHSNNGVYESILERTSTGPGNQRYSYLEHRWSINVTGGASVTFNLEAHHTVSSDGDDFDFYWSTSPSGTGTFMLRVTKTTDDNSYQSFSLPSSLTGTVYIRVVDTDHAAGHKFKDTIRIDDMYIRSQ